MFSSAARASGFGRRLYRRALPLLLPAALLLWAAPGAGAASRIYWGDCNSNTISSANLDGTGHGSDLNTTGATTDCPQGAGMDLLTGKIYWGNVLTNSATAGVSFANLDNTGGGGDLDTSGATAPNGPVGVATDPANGKIYWGDLFNPEAVSFANLDDTGSGGDLSTTGATVNGVIGVVVDPATGKIYWANNNGNTISFANLDGSGGGGDLNTTGATVNNPEGVAIDSANGKIYWGNFGDDTHPISFANLNDTGDGGNLNVSGATPGGADGVAIDPHGGKIYWANFNGDTISFAKLDNTGGGGQVNTTGASTPDGPAMPGLLKTPLFTAKPVISGGSTVGSTLSCSTGAWAPDLIESFLYQQPVSFGYKWRRSGGAISGASSSSITASRAGSYKCVVTATNQAGSTTNASALHTVS
jgi:hypothetical protein